LGCRRLYPDPGQAAHRRLMARQLGPLLRGLRRS
jgi:hypothetical protein